jgi:arabinofuranosyltransferase
MTDRRRSWQRAWLAVPATTLAIAAWRRRWVAEDAFINFRIVDVSRNAHRPLCFNTGERVEAGTSPLWLGVLTGLDATLGRRFRLERLAVVTGLGLSVLGLAAATAASARLARLRGPSRPWPAGALVLAALPPVWDFSTSGLESGLTFGWLGCCQWLLTRHYAEGAPAGAVVRPASAASSVASSVVLGLGPLVRPDLALFSAAFVTARLSLHRPGLRSVVQVAGAALAAPAAYQVFRMAYFAATVPTTALAKEAARSNWRQGRAYLENLVTPYRLAVPAALITGWTLRWLAGSTPAGDRRLRLLVAAPAGAALAHAGYVLRVGGDFMHGRLLLPATFGLFMPAAALPADDVRRVIPVAVATWAAVCALRLRLPADPPERWSGIVDERAWWQRETGRRHPVTIDDYGRVRSTRTGRHARQRAAEGADVLVRIDDSEVPLTPGSGVVLESITIGMGSVAAGPDVQVIDVLGLANALGARLPTDPAARIGHQKRMPPALVLALLRRADPDPGTLPADVHPDALQAARHLLRRPDVTRLRAAVQEPLTLRRIVRNIRQAVRLTRLRVAVDPAPVSAVGGTD